MHGTIVRVLMQSWYFAFSPSVPWSLAAVSFCMLCLKTKIPLLHEWQSHCYAVPKPISYDEALTCNRVPLFFFICSWYLQMLSAMKRSWHVISKKLSRVWLIFGARAFIKNDFPPLSSSSLLTDLRELMVQWNIYEPDQCLRSVSLCTVQMTNRLLWVQTGDG